MILFLTRSGRWGRLMSIPTVSKLVIHHQCHRTHAQTHTHLIWQGENMQTLHGKTGAELRTFTTKQLCQHLHHLRNHQSAMCSAFRVMPNFTIAFSWTKHQCVLEISCLVVYYLDPSNWWALEEKSLSVHVTRELEQVMRLLSCYNCTHDWLLRWWTNKAFW